MTREGIDFSGPRPTAQALKAAGRDFVLRYARSFTHPKSITAAEAAYWKANGIDVAIVDEVGADRALQGRAVGRADATAAKAAVISVGGPHDGGVIYCAVDFDATSGQMPAVLDYIRGYADVLGVARAGVYGSYDVCAAAKAAGVCRYFWQTYAWSGGRQFPGHLYQYSNSHTLGGVDVDYDRALTADFGQWGATPDTGGLHMDADVKTAFDAIPTATEIAQAVAVRLNPLGTDVKTVVTKVGQLLSVLQAAGVDDAKRDAAVLGAITAMPRADVDEAALAAELAKLGITLDAATIAKAVRTDLAGALAG